MEILIIRFRQPAIEEKCLESVRKFTDPKHKITVFDNYENGNINLGKLWNTLIEASDEEVICLLNSDCVVEEGWERVCEALQDPTTGAVGPTTDNCGTTQKGMPRGEIEAIGDLSGFCYLFKKSVWKKVGKFSTDMPFYGQESVFNRKLQDRGYKLMVDRRVFIHHDKGASGAPSEEAEWGAFHYWNFLDRLRILRSIVDKDFKIIIIGGGRDNPFPLHKGMEQACDEFFGSNALLLRDVHCIPEILDLFKPDLILNTETKYKENVYEFLKQAKRKGIKTALYFNDLRNPVREDQGIDPAMRTDLTPFYDSIFLCNESYRHYWEEICKVPTFYMPQGSIQHPKPPTGTKHHILHIGSESTGQYHENRYSILKDLRQNVEITSKNSAHRGERTEIQNNSYGDYHSSDYSLAISMEIKKYTSDRLYTILGAGGCAVCYKPEGLEEIFKDREHLLFFRTAQEALKIMERTTEQEREEIKLNAFKHVQKHHLHKMRLLNILQNLYTNEPPEGAEVLTKEDSDYYLKMGGAIREKDKSFHGDLNNLYKIGKL